ncbi:MAG: molybdenum cofactor biosynthesis protein MoaE [Deltaproteobacteria bacterium]|nr:molybdenum cofactor biosynthesis protein MoaE [Deltaproteobacteria bacterium]
MSIDLCPILVTTESLSIDSAYAALADERAGGVVLFVGRVRDTHQGRAVTAIHYEAYLPMAVAECERLLTEAAAQWALCRGVLWHRVGRLAVGDVSVVIGVAAAHRDTAFPAARWLIDTLKARVPIWKQECFANGSVEWNGPPASLPGASVSVSDPIRPR